MGVNVISANTQPSLNGVAGSQINIGDLVVNSEASLFYPASPVLTMAQNNNTTSGPTAISANANVTTATNYGNTNQLSSQSITQLGNNDIVSLYNGNGTTATTSLTAYTRNIQGAATVNPFTVTSDASISYFRVKTVNSSSYVVSWASGTDLKFAIYSNSGSVVKAATTIAATTISDQGSWNVEPLLNGNIVFAWRDSSNGLSYAIYDSTGNSVLAATVSESNGQPQNLVITKQSSGGFFIYYRNAAQGSYKFSRYNSSGSLQGSLTTVATSTSSSAIGCVDDNIAVEMTNGNIAFYAPNSSGFPLYYVYSSTGSLIASALDVSGSSTSIAYQNVIPGMCAIPGGFAVATSSNSTLRFFNIFNESGVFVVQRRQTTVASVSTIGSTSGVFIRAFNNGSAGLTVLEQVNTGGCSPGFGLFLYSYNTSGTQRGSTVALQTSTGGSRNTNIFGILLSEGSLAFTYRNSAGVGPFNWGSYAMLRKSVVGVSQSVASANATATVLTQGNFAINQNMTLDGYFDNRTAAVPGTRGTVVGSRAVLLGIS